MTEDAKDDKPARPAHLFKPGQSGNPGGRRPLPDHVKQAIGANAEKAVARMQAILDDDKAWGAKGWLDGKTQIKVAEVAIQRAFGPALLDTRHAKVAPGEMEADGSPALIGTVMRQAYEMLKAEGRIPEYFNARPADQMVDVTPDGGAEAAGGQPEGRKRLR